MGRMNGWHGAALTAALSMMALSACSTLGLDDDDDTPAEQTVTAAPTTPAPATAPTASAPPAASSPAAPNPVPPNPAAADPAIAPRPLWAKACLQESTGRALCYVEQAVSAPPPKGEMLHVRIGHIGPGGRARMLLTAPLGVGLQGGMSLSLDGAPAIAMTYDTCSVAGCLAIADLDQAALDKFAAGSRMTVRYMAPERTVVEIPITLTGMGAALSALEGGRR